MHIIRSVLDAKIVEELPYVSTIDDILNVKIVEEVRDVNIIGFVLNVLIVGLVFVQDVDCGKQVGGYVPLVIQSRRNESGMMRIELKYLLPSDLVSSCVISSPSFPFPFSGLIVYSFQKRRKLSIECGENANLP